MKVIQWTKGLIKNWTLAVFWDLVVRTIHAITEPEENENLLVLL